MACNLARYAVDRYTVSVMDTPRAHSINEASHDRHTPSKDARAPSALPARLGWDWLIVFAAALVLYIATCAPDVLMGDSGVYQLRVPMFPPFPPLKDTLVQVHPLYLIIAKVFTWLPVGNIAYRVNLASPFFGAMTAGWVFVSIRLLTHSRWAAAIGTLSVVLGHTFWAFSVVAECLTLASAFFTAEIFLLLLFARSGRKGWFLLALFLNGLSISNHMMGALATPAYVVLSIVWLRRGRLDGWDLLAGCGLWLGGTLLYGFLILRALLETGDLARVIRSATTGGWPATNLSITPSLLGKVAAYIGLQYPTLLGVLALVALWVRPIDSKLRAVTWALCGALAVHFVFAARYPRPDQYSFFVSFYGGLGILIGLGAWAVIRRWRWTSWALVVLAIVPVGVYAVLPPVARRLEFNPFTRELPYRDPYEFFLKPWQHNNTGVRRYVEEVFEILPKNAILFGDPTPAGALLYAQQVEKRRPDLRFAWVWDNMNMEQLLLRTFPPQWLHPVYTVADDPEYAPKVFVRDCKLVPEGILYKVIPPRRYPKTPWK